MVKSETSGRPLSLEEARLDIDNNPFVLDASINTCEHGVLLEEDCLQCGVMSGSAQGRQPVTRGPLMGAHVLHENYLRDAGVVDDFEQVGVAA